MQREYDAVIIGAGVIGSAVARELSRFRLHTAVLEKNLDVCCETSGRNSAVVHGGFAYDPGTLKARFCVAGNRMMDSLSQELDFPFSRCGKVLVGNTPEDMCQLKRIIEQGKINGASGLELIGREELLKLVPTVIGEFAMWSKNSGILDPFLYTIALAENACTNGVDYFFDHRVEGINYCRETERYTLHTQHGDFRTRWVINAAGLNCREISDMLGITGYRVIGSKGNYIILDKKTGHLLPMPVYPVPSNTYMGIHVTPTVDGNVIIGPDAENTDNFTYYGVPQDKMDLLASEAQKLWPHVDRKMQIRNYSGILPKWVDENGVIQDFKIEIRDDLAPRAVNLVGIESPGLTAAVPIAQYVVELMREREDLKDNPHFCPERHRPKRFAECTPQEQEAMIRENPDYGEIVCRCEKVTRAEVLAAIHNPLHVTTMTGIKYRTRAMMGTCQSGFCQMRIEQMLEEELKCSGTDILYNRQGSWLLAGNVREGQ